MKVQIETMCSSLVKMRVGDSKRVEILEVGGDRGKRVVTKK